MRRTAERAGPRLRPRYGIEQFRGYRQRDAIQPARSGTRHPRQRRPEASGHGARASPTRWASSCASSRSLWRRQQSTTATSHLFNHAQRRARLLKAVGADPDEPAMPVASKDLAEAATALRSSYRNQLAAIIAPMPVADDPTSIQPTISRELSDLADAGARRRAGHRPPRNRGQRARALHHHRHGQTRRTGTELRLRRGPHLRGRTGPTRTWTIRR